MKAEDGAPERAREVRRRARRSAGQRARDMVRTAGAQTARQGVLGAVGTVWIVLGLFLVLLTCTMPPGQVPWWAYLEFSAYCAAGTALHLTAAHRRRRK